MDKLFLHIFNSAITAGWLVLAVLVVRFLLKKAPAWIKCALWAIVAVRLVWPFSIESVLSLLPSAEIIPPSQLYVPAPQLHTGVQALNYAINPVFTETFRAEPSNSVNPLQVASWVAGWVWVLGMLAMAAYAGAGYLRIRRRVCFSLPAGEGVYLCDEIPAPFILGILKPRIYLPTALPQEKWGSILAHERAHLARRDHWWKPLGFVLLTVFWFQPLLWVAYILLCRDVELACDEKVVRSFSAQEKQDYSNTLLECSVPQRWITACPLAFGETGVKQRIKAVLHYKKPGLWILILALIVSAVLAVCFLTDPQGQDRAAAITAEDISGKQYVYNGQGAGSNFYINIYEDGTFQYYAGNYSSHIGLGQWELKDSKLHLYERTLQEPMTFTFSVSENMLTYIAAESYPFMYVDVKNGDLFIFHANIPLSANGRDVPGPAEVWQQIYQVIGLEAGEFTLNAFPNATVCWGDGKIQLLRDERTMILVENAIICNLGAVDLNLDGAPELCATVYTEDAGEHVLIYDIANEKPYTMADPQGTYIYYLFTTHEAGNFYVMCAKDDAATEKTVEAGRLIFTQDGVPAILDPSMDSQSGNGATVLFQRNHPDSAHQGEAEIHGFPGVSVRWYFTPNVFLGSERPVLVENGKERTLFADLPSPTSLYLADVTGDGKLDLCANIYYFFSGLPSFNAVYVYDYANDCYYCLADDRHTGHYTKVSYYLRVEKGTLVCDKIVEAENSVLATGSLYIENGSLCMRPLQTYMSPVQYSYTGKEGESSIMLTVIQEGTCKMYYTHKSDGNSTGSWLRGTYAKKGDRLYFYEENNGIYVFRMDGQNLIFEAKQSSPLPENCILPNGAVLTGNILFD